MVIAGSIVSRLGSLAHAHLDSYQGVQLGSLDHQLSFFELKWGEREVLENLGTLMASSLSCSMRASFCLYSISGCCHL